VIFGWQKTDSKEANSSRKLVVGLGNPGRKYAGTRHNVGFEVVAQVAKNYQAGAVKNKFKGEVVDVRVHEQQVMLLCPKTYMNASGSSVKPAVDFYRIDVKDVLVICDDFALDLGRLRFRPNGSSGGQKGLGDIIRSVGSDQIPRLRVGIGKPPDSWDGADFVLSKFSSKEKTEAEIAVRTAADAVVDWVESGTDYCMNKYNGK
jgi:PTH1 family peptidyl-tRNA hydrolase